MAEFTCQVGVCFWILVVSCHKMTLITKITGMPLGPDKKNIWQFNDSMAEFTWQVGGCWRGRHGNPPLAATVGLSLLLVHPLNIHVYYLLFTIPYLLSTIYYLVQLSTVQSSSKSLVSSVGSLSCKWKFFSNANYCQQRSGKLIKRNWVQAE